MIYFKRATIQPLISHRFQESTVGHPRRPTHLEARMTTAGSPSFDDSCRTSAIVLNSGGIDSRLVAAQMQGMGWELHGLYVDYGQANREGALPAAQKTADLYCEGRLKVVPYPDFRCEKNDHMPGYIEQPAYGPMAAVVGWQYAVQIGAGWVVMGCKKDSYGEEHLTGLQDLVRANKMTKPVVFSAPLWELATLSETLAKARELDVDVSDCVSCNRSWPPCGECNRCKGRKEFGL